MGIEKELPLNVEQFAAEQLAQVLDSAARTLANAAEEFTRYAEKARSGPGADGRVGYMHYINMAYNAAVNAIPNLGLTHAFEMAALADQYRTADKRES